MTAHKTIDPATDTGFLADRASPRDACDRARQADSSSISGMLMDDAPSGASPGAGKGWT